MPRKLRVFVEGGVYHVYCRVSRGDGVFLDESEAESFLDIVRQVKQRDGLIVYAWCLMSNHYRMAVRTAEVPLWRCMASIQGRTSKGFNSRHRVFRPLWQGRYKAKPVEDQRYFDQLIVYIHMNPVAAGVVEDPADHRWSGHREMIGTEDFGIADVGEALASFGSTVGRARRAYVRRLRAEREAEWLGERPGRLPWWGRSRADEDEAIAPREGVAYVDYLGRSTGPERPRFTAGVFLRRACEALGVDLEALTGRGRTSVERDLRELVSVLGVERYGQRVSDLAAALVKNPGTVSRWVSAGAARRTAEPAFVGRVQDLDQRLQTAASGGSDETL